MAAPPAAVAAADACRRLPTPAGVALGFASPLVPWPSASAARRAVVRGRPAPAGLAVGTAATRRAARARAPPPRRRRHPR